MQALGSTQNTTQETWPTQGVVQHLPAAECGYNSGTAAADTPPVRMLGTR